MLILKKKIVNSKFFFWKNISLANLKKNQKKIIFNGFYLIVFIYIFLEITPKLYSTLFRLLPEIQKNEIQGFFEDTYINEIIKSNRNSPKRTWPKNFINGLTKTPEIIELNISFKNLQYIREDRQKALMKGKFVQSKDSTQKAIIEYQNKRYPAEIRLKGDLNDHFKGINQWSFRIKLLEDNTIYGMKKFSLNVPKVRNYYGDPIYHLFLRYENLPSLRNKVVQLKLNGKNLGSYLIEEHFDKYLIENNLFREGVILALDESSWWEQERDKKLKNRISLNEKFYLNWGVKVFDNRRISEDKVLKEQYIYASKLLNKYFNEKAKASEVFDIEKTAKFLAITDLLGAQHSLYWTNLRFLYDPIIKKLIPIGFDGNATIRINSIVNNTGTLSRVFEDELIQSRYLANLKRISKPKYLEEFIAKNGDLIKKDISSLFKTYPWTYRFEDYFNNIKYNQTVIRKEINPDFNLLKTIISEISKKEAILSFSNKSYLPLDLIGITYKNELHFLPIEKTIIPPTFSYKTPNKKFVSLKNSKGVIFDEDSFKDLKVKYQILGINEKREEEIYPFILQSQNFNFDSISKSKPNAEEFNFLKIDKKQKIISFKSGDWEINKPLIIPKDYKLYADSKVNISLNKNGIVIIKGPLELKGKDNNRIKITSKNGGKGFIVLSSKELSEISFVDFSNMNFPSEKAWNISGAITFYESPIFINNSTFDSINSEDSLNIIKSTFNIKNTSFSNSKSDALDIDFGIGNLENLVFKNIGNDAIDISRTSLNAKNIIIDGSGDKAISIGERSKMFIDKLKISNSSIGIASKDLSFFEAKEVEVDSTKLGFASFQKKTEYGPGSIIIDNLIENNWSKVGNYLGVGKLQFFLLEDTSFLKINGYTFKPNVENVKEYLYGNIYGKSSK